MSSTDISYLTNNDSKVLGRSMTKLKQIQAKQNSFQTAKYQTLNSSWTPLANKSANSSVSRIFCILLAY